MRGREYWFGKHGTLFWRNGVRMYFGDELVAGHTHFVWWWPVNWVFVAIAVPAVIIRAGWNEFCAAWRGDA